MHSKIAVHRFDLEECLRTLIFGYGNYDRQDDGVAYHVISALKKKLGLSDPEIIDDDFDSTDDLVTVFQLQLTPELAESIVKFDHVCLIDAHTGSIPQDISFRKLDPAFLHSPLTHHLTPEALLSITQTIYQKIPETVLLSVRGYEFEFTQTLSPSTLDLVPQAVSLISEWLSRSI